MPPRNTGEPFVDGFNWKTVIGAFFVGCVMMPAGIYISLFSGQGLGDAAQWVTIILFAELARRSLKSLKKQEMYVLYHVASIMAGGGALAGLIWNQYLRQSPQAAAFGVAQGMPAWAAPKADSTAILDRALWHHDWWAAIGLVLLGSVLYRLNFFGLGYAIFRVTSDLEKLPFPMSAIAAEGATALAESPDKKESWRWRWFSIGSMVGLLFGIVYIGLPTVTGLVFTAPVQLLPIPWADFTTSVENILPSAPVNLTFDLGAVLWGMVMPFWAVIGSFTSCILTGIVANPILQRLGYFPTWKRGMSILATQTATWFDFWLSIGIGIALAVAAIGIWSLVKVFRAKRPKGPVKEVSDMDLLLGKEGNLSLIGGARGSLEAPKGRGDWPLWVAGLMFVGSTIGYIALCHQLVPRFPVYMLVFYGFVWTPLISYISARMIGLTGNGIGIPYMREGSFILSRYRGTDIWFAPIPLNDMSWGAPFFKQFELTRTKFTSIIKAELLTLPINIAFSFVFWAFLWHLVQIPSYTFPFVNTRWPFDALSQSLFMTATMEGRQWLIESFRLSYTIGGAAVAFGAYALISGMGWPIFIFYGMVAGVNAMPGPQLLMLTGALLGRYYFAKQWGREQWFRYAPVLGAGFAAGAGLIGMLSVGITMVSRSVVTKPF